MDRSVRGIAVIINNKNFLRSSGMDRYPRNGTDVDRDSLVKLFRMLKFDVKIYNDRTKAEIRSITKEMATFNHSNYDAFIFSILTHGEEGVIYGTDGTISIRDLTSEFKYSPSLAGKPKIFFFQACQGKKISFFSFFFSFLQLITSYGIWSSEKINNICQWTIILLLWLVDWFLNKLIVIIVTSCVLDFTFAHIYIYNTLEN